ncbi:hypothetical protein ZYGR_0S00170 [Zygosaccharomyces rouxii]|nr:hypothetical protein ZYGR_0S00170 [Zygosaccharomyces rouxii]
MLRLPTRTIRKSSLIPKRLISLKGSHLHKPASELVSNASSSNSGVGQGLGFMKSSQISMSPGFDPFDRSHAAALNQTTQSRDVMQLWSLLEACLCSKYYNRAFSILQSLYMVGPHRPYFIDDYNMYLESLVENGIMTSISQLDKKLSDDLQNTFRDVDYNDRTLAIMVHHAIKYDHLQSETQNHLKIYFRMSVGGIKSILSHVNVLTVSDYAALHADLKMINLNDVPEAVRPLLENRAQERKKLAQEELATLEENKGSVDGNPLAANDHKVEDDQNKSIFSLDQEVKPLEKDATTLKAVDTLNMRVVRHALLGLSLNETQREQILKFNFDASSNLLNMDDNRSLDFFEIYRSLSNEEDRSKFEKALDDFNQERQRALENRATDAAKERWKHDFEEAKARGDISIEKRLNVKLWQWYSAMLPLVKEEVKLCSQVFDGYANEKKNASKEDAKQERARLDYGPYLSLVDPEKMCVITILELLKLNSTGGIIEGMRTARAVISVGKAIEMEFRSEQLLKSESQAFRDLGKNSHELKK